MKGMEPSNSQHSFGSMHTFPMTLTLLVSYCHLDSTTQHPYLPPQSLTTILYCFFSPTLHPLISLNPSANTGALQMSAENFVTFLVEWHDAEAALVRSFNLRYFLNDAQIDMFDLKQRKTFLKKCSYPSITLADLYPGAQVTIFARTLKVVDYADQVTRNRLAPKKQVSDIVDDKNLSPFLSVYPFPYLSHSVPLILCFPFCVSHANVSSTF